MPALGGRHIAGHSHLFGSFWQWQDQCEKRGVAEIERIQLNITHRQNIILSPFIGKLTENMSVLALQEYEFEKQFNEDEAIRWMQENW